MTMSEHDAALRKLAYPAALITVKGNVMTAAWVTRVNGEPGDILVCIGDQAHSQDLIRRTGEFGVNIISAALVDLAIRIGSCSGREVDKFAELNIATEPAHAIGAPMIAGCAATLECRTVFARKFGDHYLFLGRVLHSHASDLEPASIFDGTIRTLGRVLAVKPA
jgi:flavin reductase (DIM6/NTAB) family NADH-FMN oxidoreductase RutF